MKEEGQGQQSTPMEVGEEQWVGGRWTRRSAAILPGKPSQAQRGLPHSPGPGAHLGSLGHHPETREWFQAQQQMPARNLDPQEPVMDASRETSRPKGLVWIRRRNIR